MNNASSIKIKIQDDMKTYMRAKDQQKLDVIRFILAALKQKEIDERITLDDSQVISILEKLIKQRKESLEHCKKAGREDLASKEEFELQILQTYMPAPLSDLEIEQLIAKAISDTNASSQRDMGKVMSQLKTHIQGRADMSFVSSKVKSKLLEKN